MVSFTKLKVVELKEELKKRGLATTGLKAVLLARLEEDEAASASLSSSSSSSTSSVMDVDEAPAAKKGATAKKPAATAVEEKMDVEDDASDASDSE
jgi:hypothetical protein